MTKLRLMGRRMGVVGSPGALEPGMAVAFIGSLVDTKGRTRVREEGALAAENPPERADRKDQAAGEGCKKGD